MSSLVLARKWRPHTFNTVAGQQHVVQTLTHALTTQRLHHAYLFTGTRGVGKTSIARIFAKALSCETGITAKPCGTCLNCTEIDAGNFIDLIEIDAASRSKVEDTREILDNVMYPPTRGRFKIYLIDEIHMLSGHSFNALLKTLEEPPEHVKFLLATTDPKKLPITVLSRCLQFHLKNMLPHEIIDHLTYILGKEHIAFETTALPWIAQAADGSLRDALSLLDQAIAHGLSEIKEKNVREMLGYIEIQAITQLVEALIARDHQALLTISQNLQHQGADCAYILRELQHLFHQISIVQCLPEYKTESSFIKIATEFAHQITTEDLQLFYQIALKGSHDLALAPTPWIAFEMTLLRMLCFQLVDISSSPSENAPSLEQSSVLVPKSENSSNKPASHQPQSHALPTTKSKSQSWEALLPLLNLSGMTKNIAQHCTLEEFSEDSTQLTLNIPLQQKAFLTVSIKQQLESSLADYFLKSFQKNITVNFHLAEKTLNSPAIKQQEQKQEELVKAKKSLDNDDKFQKILNTFHGTIIPESIKHN